VVKGKKAAVQEAADRQYRSKILAAYRDLLFVAPQFSSDFVSNFDIETPSSPVRGYQQWPEKIGRTKGGGVTGHWAEPHHAGDNSAGLVSAYMRGVQRMRYVKFGQPVFFVNPTDLQIRPPEVVGPDGARQMRDQSAIDAWTSISSYLQARHGEYA
jgi:hypothetical protein